MNLKKILTTVLALCSVCISSQAAAVTSNYPNKPIKFVIGYPPGGPSDIMTRLVAAKLQVKLGQSVIVENRPGAGGNIATDYVKRESADGYTLLLGTVAHATNMSVYNNLNYDTLKDFIPVVQFMSAPTVLVVNSKSSYKTVNDLIEDAKKYPHKLSYASTGIGGTPHLAGEELKLKSGADIMHVPYKGASPALNDLLGGYVTMSFMTYSGAIQQINAGTLRPIAIAGQSRYKGLPDVPTVIESGIKDFTDISSWNGLFVKTGTPDHIVQLLNKNINEILSTEEIQKQIEIEGALAIGGTSQEFAHYVKDEINKWAAIVSSAGIKPQ